jgi:alpha-mannosidase
MGRPKCAVTHSISLCQLLHSPLHEMAEPDGEHTSTYLILLHSRQLLVYTCVKVRYHNNVQVTLVQGV